MEITVICGSRSRNIPFERGEDLLSLLRRNGYALSADCNGRGVCGKCRVRFVTGLPSTAAADREGYVLACGTRLYETCTVELPECNFAGGEENARTFSAAESEFFDGYGVAADIGTTTLAVSLLGGRDGKRVKTVSVLNPQRIYGADVISRIKSANEGSLDGLCRAVREELDRIVRSFGIPVKKMYISGNTTMLHLFAGRPVKSLGEYPFTPLFTSVCRFSGREVGVAADEILLLPSVGAFVGADISVGAVSVGLTDGGNNLLVDIGTNGEMMLSVGDKVLCTSTAAGPCFEGANIECGSVAADGAINRVYIKDDKIQYDVIGGGEAKGLCGAGLIDGIAALRALDIIDESGRFTGDEKNFYLSESVYISQADVRAFQLAKSAVCAGLKVLISAAGITPEQIDNVFVAGGLGFYLDRGNAVAVGLIPKELSDKLRVVGNTSLTGAELCLFSGKKLAEAKSLCEKATYIDLSADPVFMDEYMENMFF